MASSPASRLLVAGRAKALWSRRSGSSTSMRSGSSLFSFEEQPETRPRQRNPPAEVCLRTGVAAADALKLVRQHLPQFPLRPYSLHLPAQKHLILPTLVDDAILAMDRLPLRAAGATTLYIGGRTQMPPLLGEHSGAPPEHCHVLASSTSHCHRLPIQWHLISLSARVHVNPPLGGQLQLWPRSYCQHVYVPSPFDRE